LPSLFLTQGIAGNKQFGLIKDSTILPVEGALYHSRYSIQEKPTGKACLRFFTGIVENRVNEELLTGVIH
jgi:hypothetical protein